MVTGLDKLRAGQRNWSLSKAGKIYLQFRSFFFDPLALLEKLRAAPYYIANWVEYRRRNRNPKFRIRIGELLFMTRDRFASAGTAKGHYFLQDLWAARHLYGRGVREHMDVGSRVDGFVAHVLTFCRVTYVDLRPLPAALENLEYRQGSLLDLPMEDSSVRSLSCLHVLEHVGLGRYGDPVDPEGYLRAAAELARVLAPGGVLLLSTPIGQERLCFDAHRVFDPGTVAEAFRGLDLLEFHLVDDDGLRILLEASFEAARKCDYGCGLFVFSKLAGGGNGRVRP